MTRTYEVRTYGCQMNAHDSERIAGLLDEAGYAPVADGAQPGGLAGDLPTEVADLRERGGSDGRFP